MVQRLREEIKGNNPIAMVVLKAQQIQARAE
jgi:hypothetical protein